MPHSWQVCVSLACFVVGFADAQVVGSLQSNCADQQCNPRLTLLLSASITQAEETATYIVPAGTMFQDEQARSWEILPNITLDLAPAVNGGPATLPSDSVYSLNYSSTSYRNAYELVQAGCANGSSAVCCDASSYSFSNNRTAYLGFTIDQTNITGLHYTLTVSSNGAFDAQLEFDMLASGEDQSTVGVAVTPSAANSDQHTAVNFTGFTFLIPQGQPTAEGFIVPTQYLGTAANMIGMTYAAWQRCFSCQQTLNCVSVPAATPTQSLDVYYDQFTAFSNSTIASALSSQYGVGCDFVSGETSSYADANFASQQTISCNFSALLVNLEVVLDLDGIGITSRLLSEPALSIVGVGSNPWVPGSAEGTLYVDVSNTGASAIACQLAAGPCCLSAAAGSCMGSAFATSSTVVTLLPNQTQQLLSYVTVNETSASGSCSFMVQANGTTVTYVSTEFEVVAANPPPPSPPPPPPPDSGITLTFQVIFSDLQYAQLEAASFFLVFTSSFRIRIAAAANLPTTDVYITALQAGQPENQGRSIATSVILSAAIQYPTAAGSLTDADSFLAELTNPNADVLGGDEYFQQFGTQAFYSASVGYAASAPQNIPLPPGDTSSSSPPPPHQPPHSINQVCSLTCGEHSAIAPSCTCVCAAGWARAANASNVIGCTVATAGLRKKFLIWELNVGSGSALAGSAAGSAAAAFAMCKIGRGFQPA